MKKILFISLLFFSFVSSAQTLLLSRQNLDDVRYRYRYITAQKRCPSCPSPRLGYDLSTDTLTAYIQQKMQSSFDLKAPLSNPVFLSSVTLPSNTVIGNISATQLGYLAGLNANIQNQLNSKVDISTGKELSANNFSNTYKLKIDSLNYNFSQKVDKISGKTLSTNDFTNTYKQKVDSLKYNFGLKADLATVNSAISANTALANSAISIANTANFQGTRLGAWNASTNSPTLTSDASAITTGGYYDVTVAGTQSITGSSTFFNVGDRVAKTGSTWYRLPYTISEKSIGVLQTNFIDKVIGKNKFNYLTATDDFYIDETGVISANSVYCYSDFIPVESSTEYYGTNGTNGMRFITFYDVNKSVVSGGASNMTNLFTTSSTTKYIRITVFKTDKATFQLVKGTAASAYENYTEKNVFNQVLLPDNSIENAQIKNGSLTPEKTNFLALGKNKFNHQTTVNNFYMGENGVAGASASYSYSDFIPVKPSTQYYGTGNGYGMRFTTYYDANKNFITGGSDSFINTFTTSANTYFVRITVYQLGKSTFQLEEGATPTAFERYGYTFDKTTINTSTEKPVEIAIAPKLYTLTNNELAVYYANIHKNSKSFEGKSEITGNYSKQTGESTKFLPTINGEFSISTVTANEDFDVINTTNSSIVSVNPVNNTPVKILNIGDSYTYLRTFTSKLSSISSNVYFLGIRTNSTLGIQSEGRGGYRLIDYFTIQKSNNRFSPFMQPSGSYKYYGVTGFWKLTLVQNPDYEHGNYDSVKGLFNATTGYKNSPSVNDVMYDDILGSFYVYNGTAWVTISESTLNFSFNFAKYRSVWSISAPDIIHIHLGTNDWYASSAEAMTTEWPAWKTNLDTFISSVKADNANVKVIVGIPNSSGKQGGIGILTTEKSNRNYWIHAKNIIANYAGREDEKIYVADYHSVIDREYAFTNNPEIPFAEYTGNYRNKYMTDFTHLSPDGFNQMGNLYAAMIQFLR